MAPVALTTRLSTWVAIGSFPNLHNTIFTWSAVLSELIARAAIAPTLGDGRATVVRREMRVDELSARESRSERVFREGGGGAWVGSATFRTSNR